MEKKKIKYWFWSIMYLLPLLLMLICAFRCGTDYSNYFINCCDLFGNDSFMLGDLQESIISLLTYFGLGENILALLSWLISYYILLAVIRIICKFFTFIFELCGGVVNE